jgi:IMP cyclohydrolase
MKTAQALLKGNPYPGRGVLIGAAGGKSVIAYFIMGRSENSRNRVFCEEGDALHIRIYDQSKVSDPSLILYAPVRVCRGNLIVTNGDQTDTIASFLEQGESFQSALDTRCYEPDAPNYTPRISGMVEQDGSFQMSILRKAAGRETCERACWRYAPQDGIGRLIHTYETDGNPIPSFAGAPREVAIEGDCEAFADSLWESLDEQNRVALYVRYTDLPTGKFESAIKNKRLGD